MKARDANKGLLPYHTQPVTVDGVPLAYDPENYPQFSEIKEIMGNTVDGLWVETVGRFAAEIYDKDLRTLSEIAELNEKRRDYIQDEAMLAIFGRKELTAATAEEYPDILEFWRNRLQGRRKRTAADIASRAPLSADDRLLRLMSLAPPIYDRESTTMDPPPTSSRSASSGVPAARSVSRRPATNLWEGGGMTVDPKPMNPPKPKAQPSSSSSTRPATLSSLMPFVPIEVTRTLRFEPQCWRVLQDHHGKRDLACTFNLFPTREQRERLREELAYEGELGVECQTIARADRQRDQDRERNMRRRQR